MKPSAPHTTPPTTKPDQKLPLPRSALQGTAESASAFKHIRASPLCTGGTCCVTAATVTKDCHRRATGRHLSSTPGSRLVQHPLQPPHFAALCQQAIQQTHTSQWACLTTRAAPRAGRTDVAARTACRRAPDRAPRRAVCSLAPAAAEEAGRGNRSYMRPWDGARAGRRAAEALQHKVGVRGAGVGAYTYRGRMRWKPWLLDVLGTSVDGTEGLPKSSRGGVAPRRWEELSRLARNCQMPMHCL